MTDNWDNEKFDDEGNPIDADDEEEIEVEDEADEYGDDDDDGADEDEERPQEKLTAEQEERNFSDDDEPSWAERRAAKKIRMMDRRQESDDAAIVEPPTPQENRKRAIATASKMLNSMAADDEAEMGITRLHDRGDNEVGPDPGLSLEMDRTGGVAELDEKIAAGVARDEDIGDLQDQRTRLVQANATRLYENRVRDGRGSSADDGEW